MSELEKNNNETWPNFIIIGAAKAGTTALVNFLSQHPEIHMSTPKEPNFFLFYDQDHDFSTLESDPSIYEPSVKLFNRLKKAAVDNKQDYFQLFSAAEDKKAVGEASVLYLFDPKAPALIKKHVPDAKLVVFLRNPIERAFSSYVQMAQIGNETRSFKQALDQEPVESENIWCSRGDYYIRPGFYAQQLKRYFDLFDQSQIKIYLYDDFVADPESIISDLYRFIGVDETFRQDLSKRRNVSGIPKNKFLFKFATKLFRSISSTASLKKIITALIPKKFLSTIRTLVFERSLKRPKMEKTDKLFLLDTYKSDILELQKLLNRDLSHWLVIEE